MEWAAWTTKSKLHSQNSTTQPGSQEPGCFAFVPKVPLKLDFAAQKKGGMAVSAVWRLICLLAPCPAKPGELGVSVHFLLLHR